MLKIGFALLFLLAGLDKFFHVLVEWNQYTLRFFPWVLGENPSGFMRIAGSVEILLALGLLWKTETFSALASLWLLAIVFNLISLGGFSDLALRDFALAIAAFSLGPLSRALEDGSSRAALPKIALASTA